jgi:DNA-binding transcriptional ArsR family regulator
MPRERRVRTITEPQDLRALAHPLRVRLLGALRLDGPATASALARRFGVTSGLTSYHLRALAERGFVEDDPGRGGGRERWWRAAHDAHEWHVPADGDADDVAGRVEAARALSAEHARVYARWIERVATTEPELEPEWRPTVTLTDRWMRLAPEQLARLGAEVEAVIARFADEAVAAEAPGARRVGTLFAAFPDSGELP